ncbi:hypothetical protein Goari_006596 [Gossypium aridum]|uniref:60S acidic ribosomal protein P1 n=1 Tax=Gossypium aridum TaxID=34290 RepID=A0A7J8XNC6_GOSAI|nr:hypothetical protein [Gossypium aridum]
MRIEKVMLESFGPPNINPKTCIYLLANSCCSCRGRETYKRKRHLQWEKENPEKLPALRAALHSFPKNPSFSDFLSEYLYRLLFLLCFCLVFNSETMSTVGEAACSYAALILYDDGIPITAEKISTLVKAANVSVESYWPSLFAKLFEKCNIEDLITNVGAGGGGAPVAAAAPVAAGGGAGAAAPPPAEEKKKEEPEEESDDDMGFSLFD